MLEVGETSDREAVENAPPAGLWNVLLIAVSIVFVTLLIVFTGRLAVWWPLYLIPILLAGLSYGAGGAVLVSTICAVAVTFLIPSHPRGADVVPQVVAGFAVFVLSGFVVGRQAQRQRMHNVELERAAIRDHLTGLYKRVYFYGRLGEEIMRCDRYGGNLGLAIIRVDDYDRFADEFGRYKADLMLEHMADVVRVTVRCSDIIGRQAPTEFAIVMPYASLEDVMALTVRVKETIAATDFEGDVLEPAVKTRVTVAVACYPFESKDQEDLIRVVHERLDAECEEGAGADAGSATSAVLMTGDQETGDSGTAPRAAHTEEGT